MAANKDPAVAAALRVPNAEIYAIDVSFPALKDKAELDYLNQQPTSFVLPPEAVDRLRAAAGTIIMDSPEFKRLLKDVGARIGSSRRGRTGGRRPMKNGEPHQLGFPSQTAATELSKGRFGAPISSASGRKRTHSPRTPSSPVPRVGLVFGPGSALMPPSP